MALSDVQCRNAKPKAKPYKLTDGNGLFLHIMPSGSKVWRFKYVMHCKEKLFTIGCYPLISLNEAREQKLQLKKMTADFIDPVLKRAEERAIERFTKITLFKDIAKEWYDLKKDDWKPRYAETVWHRLNKYIIPDLGMHSINSIRPMLILSVLRTVEKTAPEMARKLYRHIYEIFAYAKTTERAESNPAVDLKLALKPKSKGHFASLDTSEMPKFLLDLHEFKARMYRQTFLGIRLLMLTLVRTTELVKAEWSEIDFEKKIWIVPRSRMKMSRRHIVPLSRQSLEILYELRELAVHSKYVLPSFKRLTDHMSTGTILQALKRMGYDGTMTGHGFRSLGLGILEQDLKYPHKIADKQLAHVPKSSTNQAYDRAYYLEDRKKMMQHYADHLDSLLHKGLSKDSPSTQKENHEVKWSMSNYSTTFSYNMY